MNKQTETGNIVTLYQRELFKKIPHLGTFCTQSVNEVLNRTRKWHITCSPREQLRMMTTFRWS